MTPARIAIVLVALIAAVGLALFVHAIFVKPRPAAPPPVVAVAPPPPTTRVLVAKTDLGVGDRLSLDNMSWQSWPASTTNAAYITDGVVGQISQGAAGAVQKVGVAVSDLTSGGGPKMQALVGAVVRQPIYAGQPITDRVIIRSGDTSYMAVRLPAGMRAISVPLNVESGAGGFIEPGDRIDLLSTHTDPSHPGLVTDTVLANALVLAIDQKTDSPKAGATMVGATLTLEVPAANADAVAKARSQGGLTFALRSFADMAGRTIAKGPPTDDQSQALRIFRGGAPAETVSAP